MSRAMADADLSHFEKQVRAEADLLHSAALAADIEVAAIVYAARRARERVSDERYRPHWPDPAEELADDLLGRDRD